jgi:uncharacterized protein YggE
MSRIATLTIATALLGVAAPAASAQAPPTITATGSATAKPDPTDRKSDSSIREAVEAANAKALPQAIAEAREHAGELATAAGMRLGALISIADAPATGYPFIYSFGTFGNGKFCGQVRNTHTVVRNGVRRRVAGNGTHKVCRVPPTVVASVSLTFATG